MLLFFGIYGFIIIIVIILANNKSSNDEYPISSLEKSTSADTLFMAPLKETPEEKKIVNTKKKIQTNIKKVTMNGYDPVTKTIISPINLWKNYQTRAYAGKVSHGEKITLIRREGDAVLVETSSGVQGWVTYWFIKELD